MTDIKKLEIKESFNEQDTERIAKEFGQFLTPNDVIILCGELGTGKTAFTRGLADSLQINSRFVSSPTFTLMNIYKGKLNIFHVDFYRILGSEDIFYEEVEEVINSGGITVIEWGNLFASTLKEIAEGRVHLVNIKRVSETSREITIEKNINN